MLHINFTVVSNSVTIDIQGTTDTNNPYWKMSYILFLVIGGIE